MSVSKKQAERQVVDQSGTVWRITEVRVWDSNGREASSLIAANERGFRRLWTFPSNWAQLDDAELANLVGKPSAKDRKQAAS
jgi:hypothetical protein